MLEAVSDKASYLNMCCEPMKDYFMLHFYHTLMKEAILKIFGIGSLVYV
jgi:hypothetical protein